MGAGFEQGGLLALLALGHGMSYAHRPVANVLIGLGWHGKPALMGLAGAAVSAIMAPLVIWGFHGGLVGAACAIVLPLTVVDGLVIPIYACGRLGVTLPAFYRRVWTGAILCSIPSAIWAESASIWFSPFQSLLVGGFGAGLIFAAVCWRWGISEGQRARIRQGLTRRQVSAAAPSAS
jgi:hypothetical protein